MKRLSILIPFFFIIYSYGQQKPIVASDLMKIATANQIQISPDGNKAVIVVTRKAVKNDNEYYYTNHLYLLDLTKKELPRQLTFGERNDSQPQWSPDGKQIAFTRLDGEKSQIWLLPLGGGEASVITKSEFGAASPRWSPDGKKILYTASIPQYSIEGKAGWVSERPGRKDGDEQNFKSMKADERKKVTTSPDGTVDDIRAWLAKNASEGNPRVLNRLDLQGETNLEADIKFAHLFIKTLGEETPLQLTSGLQNFNNPEWSPNGKMIICDSRVLAIHPDREPDSDLWTIDVTSKQTRMLLKWDGYSIASPEYSPDGKNISFTVSTTDKRYYAQTMLAVVPSTGEKPMILTQSFDRDLSAINWSGDSKTIYFSAQTGGAIPLFSIGVKGGTVSKLTTDESGVNDFDVSGDRVVCAITEIKNPWEIYSLSIKSKQREQLTQLNEVWLKDRIVTTPTSHEITRPDGVKIQYWVTTPVGKKENVKYPTILNIHGGPAAMWGPGVFSMWHEFQLENSWGYGLVYCNPRGSGGYGDKFKRSNFRDWGTGPAGDILAALDDAVKNNTWIDKDQLFIEGGSYAGYMVAWIVGHDQRFKAANAQRGVYELTTFMGEGNAWRLVPDHFGGYPWEKETRAILEANSPLTYVNNINTPLLIIHGDQDLRTGVIQSEMLYKSLKILNRPVEYIRYPKEGHELTRSGNPGRMMDHMLRVIEFFERYVKHP